MNNYYLIQNFTNNGALGISYQVFEEIARICVSEVKGAFIFDNEGLFRTSRPISCDIKSDGIEIVIVLKIGYQLNVNEISHEVQEKVQNAIYNMTEIKPIKVDIKVAGVK